MVLRNDICEVTISIDQTYTVESTDNRPYDFIFNPRHFTHSDRYSVFSIQIALPRKTTSIALIGDYYSYDSDCAVLEGEVLTILQNRSIVQLDVTNCSMTLFKQFDCLGCNYAIYSVENGYIIYGEIEIIMLDFNFDRKWSFSGRDIFASVSGKNPFELCEKSIKLYDFEDNFYELDFMGNLISEAEK